jgi:hypothetical protein
MCSLYKGRGAVKPETRSAFLLLIDEKMTIWEKERIAHQVWNDCEMDDAVTAYKKWAKKAVLAEEL